MLRGGLTICAALAVALLARKFFLALDTLENALEDGLSEKSFGDWPHRAAGDDESFFHGIHNDTKGQHDHA